MRILDARFALLTVLLATGLGCQSTPTPRGSGLVDSNALPSTIALWNNLYDLQGQAVLFGHEDDLAYGTTWWAEPGRSDVKEASGSYPAVYGWDLGDLENGAETNLDGVSFAAMAQWMREVHERGGINTVSWHMDNLTNGRDSWDTTRTVVHLLPGGSHHEAFNEALDRLAAYVSSITVKTTWWGKKEAIPIFFRPWHEHTGGWFWWGTTGTTPAEYIDLWQYTVTYLRDQKGVHNLMYVYSPNTGDTLDTPFYFERYPGDAYVDVLGLDDYWTLHPKNDADGMAVARMAAYLSLVAKEATARGKLAAFTESGIESVAETTWFSERLLKALDWDEHTRKMSWSLVWRNALDRSMPGHYYAPYAGHPAERDFRAFRSHPLILFEDDLPW